MYGQILEGRKILVVSNEHEVLNTVTEALAALEVVVVGNADEARPLIAKKFFDLVILDTAGANGCDLLEDCRQNKLPAAMLTPREEKVRTLNVAMKRGATSFFPKDELQRLPENVAELLERLDERKTYWTRFFQGLGAAFKEASRIVWEEIDRHPKIPY